LGRDGRGILHKKILQKRLMFMVMVVYFLYKEGHIQSILKKTGNEITKENKQSLQYCMASKEHS
jgi:hypothetical protein